MRYSTNILVAAAIIIFLSTSGFVFAQTPNVQKALEDTKESLDDLVTAKDKDSPFDVALRIQTFKKVVALALSEAKDLKIQLLAFDTIEDPDLLLWKEAMLKALGEVITYYEGEQTFINENEAAVDLETIQRIARGFKDWREANYLAVHTQIQEFFLIEREEQALDIANKRWEKIEGDLTKLERAGVGKIETLREFLTNAGDLILTAQEINEEAFLLFTSLYVSPLTATSTPEISTSTQEVATSTPEETATSTTQETPTSTPEIATTTPEEIATSTPLEALLPLTGSTPKRETSTSTSTVETVALPEPQVSIKGLVKSSLQNIREAYRAFIEMSNFVRKLLS